MTFWGVTPSGEEIFLGTPVAFSLTRDKDAPADLLRAKFAVSAMWQSFAWVKLYRHGKPVFRGPVDEQNTALTAAGLTVELVCRSMEALLLDNEAEPGVLRGPSLPLLEQRLLAPLGLSLGRGDREQKRGELTVQKGASCWAVLEEFCRDRLGCTPLADSEGAVHCEAVEGGDHELTHVLSAQLERLPCKRLSEVWLQSHRGSYDTCYREKLPGVRRRRYLALGSGKDPRQLLAAGRRQSLLLTVTCEGFLWPERGDTASVSLPGMGHFEKRPIESALIRWDENGRRTRLKLEAAEEEEGE